MTKFALTGRVMARANFSSVSGAQVTLEVGGTTISTVSDSEGQFAFANVPAGDGQGSTIRVHAPGFGLYKVSNHEFDGGTGYGVSIMLTPTDHVVTLPSDPSRPEGSNSGPDPQENPTYEGTTPNQSSDPNAEENESYNPGERVDTASAKQCTDTKNSFDHCRTPGMIWVQEYHDCGSQTEGSKQAVSWKYYVFHVLGHEIGGEFDDHELNADESDRYMRANFSIASNFAWFRRVVRGEGKESKPISGSTSSAQCYDTDISIPSWWDKGADDAREKADYPLAHRWYDTTDAAPWPKGLAETVFRAGTHDSCDPPYHFVQDGFDQNFFSQHDAAQCAKQEDWGWAVIVDKYYPDNRNSDGWEIRDVWAPDFDGASAARASDGKVAINWDGTGIWRSQVFRCSHTSDDVLVCDHEIFDRGFSEKCNCIKTFAKDDAARGTQYKIKISGPGGNKVKFVTYD